MTEPTRHHAELPRASKRLVAACIVLAAVVHSFLVMLWVMPANPIRSAVGPARVQRYISNPVLPLDQSWSVFAPVPIHGEEYILIRAFIGDPATGVGKLTNWYDVSADYESRIPYVLTPSRVHLVPARVAANLGQTGANLNPAQKKVLSVGFDRRHLPQLRRALLKLNKGGADGRRAVTAYLKYDEMMTRYVSLYARARWGSGITLVQYQIGIRWVPDFTQRHQYTLQDVKVAFTVHGFRPATWSSGGDATRRIFAKYVRRAPAGDFERIERHDGKLWVDGKPIGPVASAGNSGATR